MGVWGKRGKKEKEGESVHEKVADVSGGGKEIQKGDRSAADKGQVYGNCCKSDHIEMGTVKKGSVGKSPSGLIQRDRGYSRLE